MRSARQKLYDDFYYHFERWLVAVWEDFRIRRRMGRIPTEPRVREAYKTVIRPYWASFGVRSKLHWVKDNYLTSGSLDPRYIPNDLYITKIVPHFNDLASVASLTDKNLNSLLFPDVKRPETAFKHMSGLYRREDFSLLTRAEAAACLRPDRDYVIKPARDSSGGMGVKFFSGGDPVEELLDAYEDTDYIVQAAVRQHPDLALFNESSVNTIRLITLVWRGQARCLAAILRVGKPGSRVDNTGAGGYFCAIAPDGTVGDKAYAWQDGQDRILQGEINGVAFAGRRVPCFDKARDTVLDLAARTPHLNLLAWDMAVDEKGDVVLIEYNAAYPTLVRVCGPLFGDLTEDILTEIFKKREEKP